MKKSIVVLLLVFSCILSLTSVSTAAVIYQEGFELNNGGYTDSGINGTWQWGDPSGSVWPYAAATGFNCWGTNLSGNYLNNSNFVLQSGWIDLTSYSPGTKLSLKWKQALCIESVAFDQAYCRGETPDETFTLWQHAGGYVREGWSERSADISFAAGKQFRVSWQMQTDGSVEYEGLYIDDVTIEIPIEKATTPSPEDGSLDVTVDPTLSWVHSGDVSFDVYLGTESNDLPLLAGGLSEMSYAASGLDSSTTYYWRVDVRSGDLGISGDVWSFTTEEGGCVIPDGGSSGGCDASGLGLIGLALFAPLGLLLRKSR